MQPIDNFVSAVLVSQSSFDHFGGTFHHTNINVFCLQTYDYQALYRCKYFFKLEVNFAEYCDKYKLPMNWIYGKCLLNPSFVLDFSFKCIRFMGPSWLSGNPGVLGSSHTGSFGFFHGSVFGQDTSEPQPSTGETQERHE